MERSKIVQKEIKTRPRDINESHLEIISANLLRTNRPERR